MANINVVLDKPITDGSKLKFRTPCDSTIIEGLEVKTPAKDGFGAVIKKFIFKDAHGTELSGVGNLFVGGVMIEVLLDVTHGVAFIQNADTNSYVESVKGEVARLDAAYKEFLAIADKSVKECDRAAEAIYIGDGDMPEKALIQIDPAGSVIAVDTELDETSDNLITNNPVAKEFAAVYSETRRIDETVAEISGDLSSRIDENATTIADNASAIESNASAIAGKADAGYGYGEELTLQTMDYDFDVYNNSDDAEAAFLDNVIAEWSNGTTKRMYVDFQHGVGATIITVTKTSPISALVSGVNISGQTYERRKDNNKWSEWLHKNPEMYAGIEYATTERYGSKIVYTKRISFGALPTPKDTGDGLRQIDHNIEGIDKIVDIAGTVYYTETGYCSSLSMVYGVKFVQASTTKLRIITVAGSSTDNSGTETYVTLKYTKS